MRINTFSFSIVAVMLVAGMLVSCKKKKIADAIPVISSAEVEFVGNDSVMFKFHFIDGDGDVGLLPEQVDVPPYNQSYQPGDPIFLYSNLQGGVWVTDSFNLNAYPITIEYWALDNGSWIKPDIKPFTIFPLFSLTPDGQDKYLEGDITTGTKIINLTNSWVRDTMMFKIKLKDRMLNHSNVLDSPMMLAP